MSAQRRARRARLATPALSTIRPDMIPAGGEILLICLRVGGVRHIPPGSQLGECCECGSPVWISAATLTVVGSRPRQALCVDCVDSLPSVGR